jgi:uncharacterized membrane-anchored protein
MTKRALIAFIAAVVIQLLILVAVPARKVFTIATGKTVILKVQPVDPYSILSGYYATLGFDISRIDAFANAGGTSGGFSERAWCYAVVENGEDGIWKPVSLDRELPDNLPDNRVALLGQIRDGLITYGIEEFYIPEAQRHSIAEDLRSNVDKARVEVKVDRSGYAALQRLLIEDRSYE